jgi:tetratricopeptide (TPR) repeat protein
MKPADIVREIYQTAVKIPEPFSSLSEDEKQSASRLMNRFEEAEAKYGVLPHVEFLRPMLLSKNGRYEEALALTEQSYQQSPNWETAVAAANAARRAGDLERAAAMFAKGAEHDPNDETCLLEIGDIRLGQDRCADALVAYEKVLGKDAMHQWALPSAFYCRYRLGIEGNWLASLREVVHQEGCTCGLEGCLTSVFGGYGSSDGIARAEYLLSKIDDPG